MAQSVEVLVSTMNASSPEALVAKMRLANVDADVLVVNQCTDCSAPAVCEAGRVRMHSFVERGLSRSRNHALELSRGDILVIADDDIRYRDGFVETIRAAYAARPEADGITFQCADLESARPLRAYASSSRPHTRLTLPSVASVEITLKRERLRGLRFDPAFGLGTPLPQGEEAIFLLDALRAGQRFWFEPATICEHPGDSSGNKPWDRAMLRTKGAVLRRAYPQLWPALCAWFTATKYPLYSGHVGPVGAAANLLHGARHGPAGDERS